MHHPLFIGQELKMTSYMLKVKSQEGQKILRDLEPSMKLGDFLLQLSYCTSISKNCLQVLSGFPPKMLDLSNENVTLKESGLCSGDTVIVEKSTKIKDDIIKEFKPVTGLLMKKVVPADNSCLFTSIG